MKLIEEITRIKGMLSLNEETEESINARKVDLLIKILFGDIKKVKFIGGGDDEYFWIKNYDDNVDYSNMSYEGYADEYGEDDVIFAKNTYGRLWIRNCEFFDLYKDNYIGDDSDVTNQKHYESIKDYIKEKYGHNIKDVSIEDCHDDWW